MVLQECNEVILAFLTPMTVITFIDKKHILLKSVQALDPVDVDAPYKPMRFSEKSLLGRSEMIQRNSKSFVPRIVITTTDPVIRGSRLHPAP